MKKTFDLMIVFSISLKIWLSISWNSISWTPLFWIAKKDKVHFSVRNRTHRCTVFETGLRGGGGQGRSLSFFGKFNWMEYLGLWKTNQGVVLRLCCISIAFIIIIYYFIIIIVRWYSGWLFLTRQTQTRNRHKLD